MNIETIRNHLHEMLYQNHTFVYLGTRGQNEKFSGTIIQIYPRIFLVKTNDGKLKSFSYSDFAIRALKIVS